MNIEIISGSARTHSVTFRIALFLQKYFSANSGHSIGLIDVREWGLPFVDNVFSSIDKTPEPYKPLSERIFSADAFILVTPEYNGSYSPALKNLFDHYPKQAHKAFGLVTASDGALGGMRAAQQLITLTAGLFGIASPGLLIIPKMSEKINENGELIEPVFENTVKNFAAEFLWLAEKLNTK